MSWIIVSLIIFGLLVFVYAILAFIDRESIYRSWNEYIQNQCNYQNETDRAFRNIPSLQSAWVCQNEYVREMHLSIFLFHDEILCKVEEYFKAMIECAEESAGVHNRRGGTRYFPFIVNKEKTSLFETFGLGSFNCQAFNLGLLIIEPGTITPWQQGISRGVYRYHYALKIPKDGEFGLYLRDRRPRDATDEVPIHRLKWREKQGFIWDDNLDHHIGNQSQESCFLLIADVPRHFSWKHQWINNLLHTYFPPT